MPSEQKRNAQNREHQYQNPDAAGLHWFRQLVAHQNSQREAHAIHQVKTRNRYNICHATSILDSLGGASPI